MFKPIYIISVWHLATINYKFQFIKVEMIETVCQFYYLMNIHGKLQLGTVLLLCNQEMYE
jgi:hypothetical protein